MRKTLSYLVAATAFSFGAPAFAADSELVVFDWVDMKTKCSSKII